MPNIPSSVVISDLFYAKGYKTYLEVGVATGNTIGPISQISGLQRVVGVDPDPKCQYVTHPVKSDDFFATNKETFDVIFVDGLHLEEQVDKDIENALKILNEGGVILIHDANPATKEHGGEKWVLAEWNGTVWRSVVKVRCIRPDLTLKTVETDYGLAVLTRGPSEVYNKSDVNTCLTWEYFEANRKEILNLISLQEFRKIYT